MRRNLWRECCWLLAIVAWGAPPTARAVTVRPAPAPDPRAEPPYPGSEAPSPPEAAAPRTMVDRDEQRVRDYVSDHEMAKDVPTKVRIVGDLATPPPAANLHLGFVPRQTYVQVRRSDKELHLPRRAALADAETAEDLLNAPRLREVVSHKKTQEVSAPPNCRFPPGIRNGEPVKLRALPRIIPDRGEMNVNFRITFIEISKSASTKKGMPSICVHPYKTVPCCRFGVKARGSN